MAGIDNIRSGQSLTTTSRAPARSDTNSSSSSSTNTTSKTSVAPQQDAVSLSTQSKAMGEMHNEMAATPSFDSAKVAAIKEAIANGSYVVDPEKLADNMIKFEQELGGFK
ncbi:flagellar biosynthesis anti-sigma factor FlgM [Vibrio sp. V27_P1S3P104]|uniref:flagellar biosynthesis anti-sigma factor FlgM n=1 Tax=unclassified Vibrio TaxID=2614977 RepID=UPI0013730423|nr:MULTISPECIES: flagellar biosynthesis anti-sigma factor FlgM [unclassified Vibrio]NAW68521.1 flagellar biosynthesis anti-sigma factor FlgM [Vibrio sp. V28_P6S34P95]NAX06546.1 flagellar biosynthesis anti-sigma factor FlgM [Vibrio sp. V30_P3S12P165]NAX33614.1 flagellar biosynthesis anti-sigma factor FlgM [Vibrio sp. V29_P1S30P107]NAX37939.1 flagellar biosynthesis anti-sigma factor FlgM [Vibrio sp. V27_P1S3P104]NAX39800.1 flagellar biosynthesis anti-sigma factor FlgM [Vibrio sp. V26_P1S5P106]